MRELKFKVWHEKDSLMYGPWEISEVARFAERVFNTNPATGANLVWLQFTGLMDKNENEIYEGDIVQRYDSGKRVGVVGSEWGSDTIWCGYMVVSDDGQYRFVNYGNIEVVGNIYENPDMLKN